MIFFSFCVFFEYDLIESDVHFFLDFLENDVYATTRLYKYNRVTPN